VSTLSSLYALSRINVKNTWLHRWIYYLAAGLMYLAVLLRAIIGFHGSPQFSFVMILLLAWGLFFLVNELLIRNHHGPSILLACVELLVILSLLLITHSIRSDLFAFLFAVTAMQVMQRHTPLFTATVMGLSVLMTFFCLFQLYGILQALALTLVYNSLSVFVAAYIWTTRQARTIQEQQLMLTNELQVANRMLDRHAHQTQQLITSRERQRLARELHDSVTQTIFSMTLAVQTARMALKRDRHKVAIQLDRLDYLAQGALSEMQALVSQLVPIERPRDFFELIKQHLMERERFDDLSVNLQVEGDQSLSAVEESCLYRITQEALNNVIKHAHTKTASLRLHLTHPLYMEIEDHGMGFDPDDDKGDGKMGLRGMRERAAEIGWIFEVKSTPGQGSLIRIQKGS
jgi:signal transduction histidine kinase